MRAFAARPFGSIPRHTWDASSAVGVLPMPLDAVLTFHRRSIAARSSVRWLIDEHRIIIDPASVYKAFGDPVQDALAQGGSLLHVLKS
jgi:hypothetical protein